MKLKKSLSEIEEMSSKIQIKIGDFKKNPNSVIEDINEAKLLKNMIYEKTSRVFIYNLKKLIQIEGTQKMLAKKIGITEDLLSKYKSGDAFPAIETLIYISEVYGININKLVTTTLTVEEVDRMENNMDIDTNIFEERYYTYFFVTNKSKEGAIHEGIMEIARNDVTFKILSEDKVVKSFVGNYSISEKLIFFNLYSSEDGNAYINMIKPNINKNKYVGGLAMLLLPSDANSKPCVQKVLFSKKRIDRGSNYEKLRDIISFKLDEITFGNVKISPAEDEEAYNFIGKFVE
jgi:transcriptional regulator with XRE-family HTH domain